MRTIYFMIAVTVCACKTRESYYGTANLSEASICVSPSSSAMDSTDVATRYFDLCISHEQLREKAVIKLADLNDYDSVRVFVPPGGTVTNAWLSKSDSVDSVIAETYLSSVFAFESRSMNISALANNKYFLNYMSCHWGSELWIEVE